MRRKLLALAALLLAGLLILTGCGGPEKVSFADPTADLPLATAAVTKAATEAPSGTAAKASAKKATKAPKKSPTASPAPAEKTGPVTAPQEIADYIFVHGELPPNFITKDEAKALGWDSSRNYVSDAAPGKSLGGDRYGNYEGLLPKAKGRKFYECDCNYTGGKRGAERIVYSSDGHVWYSPDHYETFTELYPSD